MIRIHRACLPVRQAAISTKKRDAANWNAKNIEVVIFKELDWNYNCLTFVN